MLNKISFLSFILLVIYFFYGCEKLITNNTNEKDIKNTKIETQPVENIKHKSATLCGLITLTTDVVIYERGFVVGFTPEVSFDNNERVFIFPDTALNFKLNISEFTAQTTYYIKAYVKVGGEVLYGNAISFSTLDAEFKLAYVSGNKQKYPGGGMPKPMVFMVYNATEGEHVSELTKYNLTLEASSTIGQDDGGFSDKIIGACTNCIEGYWYVPPIGDSAPYVLEVTINLKKRGEIIDSYLIEQYIQLPPY